jgi:tetratricopeptide (TPR) repeat protein
VVYGFFALDSQFMFKFKKPSEKHIIPIWSGNSFRSAMPLGAAMIVLIAFIAYFPTLSNGFVSDDDVLLINNNLVKISDGLRRFWCSVEAMDYWPVTNTTFWIEWRLWGINPAGYHVTNLILHVAESLLIWILLRKLSIPGAFLAALIFAVHPVNVESVAWIAQRKNLTAMLFFLLSILWYLKAIMPTASVGMASARSHGGPWEQEKIRSPLSTLHSPLWYWLSLAAFILAMLGKGSAAVLPVLLLGIVWRLQPVGTVPVFVSTKMGLSPFMRKELVRTAPFFLVALIFSAVNVWCQTHGMEVVIRNAGYLERLLGAGCVIWFYLYKAILPVNLAFIYPQWRIETGNLLWWLPLLAALVVTAVLWRYRETWSRPFLSAWGFFCVALTPVMGFRDTLFMRVSLVADHYQHIAIIGVIALASAGFSAWNSRTRAAMRWAAIAAAGLAAGVLVLATWRQCALYRDDITIFRDTLEKNPACWMAQYNLGVAMARAGLPEESIEHYRQALQLYPEFIMANYNMANAFLDMGRLQEAIERYFLVLRLKPDHAAAHYNLGNALVQTGRNREAIEHYRQAVAINPDFTEAYYNLGNIFEAAGQYQQAIDYYRQALRLKPDDFDILNNLGIALAQKGRSEEAVEHFQRALALKPNFETHYNLGLTLARLGRRPEAIEHYRQALRIKPDYYAAYLNLMSAYAETGRSAEALATAKKALAIARYQQQTAPARQIEDWLNSYRAKLSNKP